MQRRATSSKKRSSRSAVEQEAVSMLMEDHKKVQELFRDFQKAHEQDDSETCQQIATLTCAELEVHATLEEEIFYPAAREALGDDEDLIDEAEVEHQSVKGLIANLRAMNAGDQKFAATFTVLAEYVKHHVTEEEGEIFPKVKKAKLDVHALGQDMASRKTQLAQDMGLTDDEGKDAEDDMDDEEMPRSPRRARVSG